MDVRDYPTIVYLNGKPITKTIKNNHAKTIANLLKKAGYKTSQISLRGVKKMTKRRKRRSSNRKTYKKKSSAKNKAHGRPVYKVKGGYRLGRKKRR